MPLAEPRSAVAARPTKPVAAAWAKKVPTPTSVETDSHRRELRHQQQRQAEDGERERNPDRRPRAEALHGAAGKRRGDDRRQEHEIDKAKRHAAERERLANEHEVHVGEGADEREQDAEADGERRA